MQDSAGTTAWSYDALDRLTGASYPNGDQVEYALDPVGNRTGLTVNGATTTSTYDAADEITASGARRTPTTRTGTSSPRRWAGSRPPTATTRSTG